ncbi:MAG: MMPL family transporter, partial [Deltaproteobacteria bacterium]
QARVTFLAFAIVFLFCGITFRSVTAGILFMIPIAVSNYLTYALMGARGIGLDVNVLPVVSLGVGLGVDYGLYIISRIEEEYKENRNLESAVLTSIATAGRAVTFTATTMVVGIIFWAWSFLRFQADMGLLLAFWMIVSMLGGLLLLPTIIYLIKPKFICR